jgi:hypothetical protein
LARALVPVLQGGEPLTFEPAVLDEAGVRLDGRLKRATRSTSGSAIKPISSSPSTSCS